jgi:hypothetical protein
MRIILSLVAFALSLFILIFVISFLISGFGTLEKVISVVLSAGVAAATYASMRKKAQ